VLVDTSMKGARSSHPKRGALRSRVLLLGALAALGYTTDARADDPDPWLSRDKALHFDVSAGLAAAGYGVSAGWLVDARWKALALGGGVALVAGAAKEVADATGLVRGDPSWKDFTWDVLGTVAGLALAWSVDLIVGGVNASHPAFGAPPPSGVLPADAAVRF
jgi:putative lipoprotein